MLEVCNRDSRPPARWSAHKASVKECFPAALQYYGDRRTGKIVGKSFEEWGDPVNEEKAMALYGTEIRKIERAFFAVNYSRGFTGRGCE